MSLRAKIRYQIYNVRGILGYSGLFGRLNPPILLVGSPNSGTQILGKAISLHPAIENRSEARLLWDKDFHTKMNDTLKTAVDARRADLIRLRGNFCYYQWLSGKPVVLNRHPENSLRIHFMKKIFPSAKIIHIVRDGRASVCSNYRSAKRKKDRRSNPFGSYLRPPGWRDYLDRPVLEQLAYMWNEAVLYAAIEGRKYGADYMEVAYEELPGNAAGIVRAIWDWIGLKFTDDLLRGLPKFENRNYKWKTELTEDEIAAVESIAGDGLRYFGYLDSAHDRHRSPNRDAP